MSLSVKDVVPTQSNIQPEIQHSFDFTGGEAVCRNVHKFVGTLDWNTVPEHVRDRLKYLLLDLLGVLACGTNTKLSHIIRDFVASECAVGGDAAGAQLPFDGRTVSPSGAALAIGMTIDSIDAHDGHRPCKGHIGCASLAAVLATAQDLKIITGPDTGSNVGKEVLLSLLIGYEIGSRAGQALHKDPVTGTQYHASGSWVALAAAAIGCRRFELNFEQFQHALGIAEYHGPRGLMMKCIQEPTMLKDSSGQGAMAGLSAASLARSGFTGAPVQSIESSHLQSLWHDLGQSWDVVKQYVKPWPVCRWAQPPMEAAMQICADHSFESSEIAAVHIESFEEAVRLSRTPPTDTEAAQYNIAFPLAAYLSRGEVTADEITDPDIFEDPEICRLIATMTFESKAEFNDPFPEERLARVRITLVSGESLQSKIVAARGDPETMLTPSDFEDKFHALAKGQWSQTQREEVIACVQTLDSEPQSYRLLLSLLCNL